MVAMTDTARKFFEACEVGARDGRAAKRTARATRRFRRKLNPWLISPPWSSTRNG